MVDLICPSCGRVGSAPNEKARGRLVCKKCNAVFHLGADGRIHRGEPHLAQEKPLLQPVAKAKSKEPGEGFSLPSVQDLNRPLLGALAALLVVGLGVLSYTGFAQASDTLEMRARIVAQALVNSDLKTLKRYSTTASSQDVVQLHANIQPHIDQLKANSLTGQITSSVIVMSEDSSVGAGQVSLFLAPSGIKPRGNAGENGKAPAKTTQEIGLAWVKDSSGHWLLDGQTTLQQMVVSN